MTPPDPITAAESTLGQFAAPSETPIIVIEEQVTRDHHKHNSTAIVGFRATSNHGPAYVSPRTREDHFYRKRQAYCLSLDIIEMLERDGLTTVFIGENDTGTMYQYDLGQFWGEHSFEVNYEKGDHQRGVPIENAVSWDASEVRVS